MVTQGSFSDFEGSGCHVLKGFRASVYGCATVGGSTVLGEGNRKVLVIYQTGRGATQAGSCASVERAYRCAVSHSNLTDS